MNYFSVNYSALKDYIQKEKNRLNLIDILFLLENNIINWQQYEDLTTIVSIPMYNYNSFINQDKGYYHQQGPLTLEQNFKSLLANRNIPRLIKKSLYKK